MPRYKSRPAQPRAKASRDWLEDALGGAGGAERVRNFLRLLKHIKGVRAGRPFELAPWQWKEVVQPLYDTFREDGTRQFRQGYVSFARKNGKSSLAAALSLYHLVADHEQGAEVYCAASSQNQARIVFDLCAAMAQSSELLRTRLDVSPALKVIKYGTSTLKALAADVPHLHGLNSSFVIVDEIAQQPNRELYDVLVTSMGARRQPLMLSVGTAGYDKHSVAYELYAHSKAVLAGQVFDPAFFALVKEVPAELDWSNELHWYLANPGLGGFRDLEELRTARDRALMVPSQRNTFENLYLNRWTENVTKWIDLSKWDALEPLDPAGLEDLPCWLGLDLSATTDITAISQVFSHGDGSYSVKVRSFLPAEDLRERSRRDRVPYEQWSKAGWVELTSGTATDIGHIEEELRRICESFQVREVIYDAWSARQLAQNLSADDITCIEFNQSGRTYNEPTKTFERLILEGKLRHDGNPLLRWMLDCTDLKHDTLGFVKPVKPDRRKDFRRIDGVVATIMALSRAMLDAGSGPSVYESRGVLVF
jgi:phage terminase large subunit-like protein